MCPTNKYPDPAYHGSTSLILFQNLKSGSNVEFAGNTNGNGVVRNNFDVPVLAKRIRFKATSWNRGIALAVAVYGYTQGSFNHLWCEQVKGT